MIFSRSDMGTEADGRLNPDFCRRCLNNGHFSHNHNQGGMDGLYAYTVPAPFVMGSGPWGYGPGQLGLYGVGYPMPVYPADRVE